MTTEFPPAFVRQYESHLKHLKLKGLQPKTIDAYSRAIRRLGGYFDYRIDALSEAQLTEYFSDLIGTHSWSAVKLDLYGLKFLPGELRPLAFRHAEAVYTALFACAWATVQSFCRNDRQLKGEAGAVAVLHTHSRRLDLHPHVHLVMPGASLDAKSRRWRTKTGYLFNHRALAKAFRGKLLAALKAAGLSLPSPLPLQKWVVDCKSVGNGDKALVYLGRYLYRGVLREADILACDPDGNGQVSFRYRDSRSGKMQVRTLPGADFLHLLLQHVLPKGFRRARNYGFLHPNKKSLIALLHLVLRITPPSAPPTEKPRPAFLCPCCGKPMQVIRRRIVPSGARRRDTEAATETAV